MSQTRERQEPTMSAPDVLVELSGKVQAAHRERLALVYVRQSTPQQVLDHQESTRIQYGLRRRAEALGWVPERVHVIDDDLGKSGASAVDRTGFQRLVAEVSLGHVGLILGIDMSRLADERSRTPLATATHGGTLIKAQQGQLRFPLPIGLTHDPRGQIVLDPDEQVQQAVRLIFTLFERHGSAMAVLRHFSAAALRFPRRCREPGRRGDLAWETLRHGRVLSILHNPLYAGAYVFGRRRQRRLHAADGAATTVRVERVARTDWPIVRQDAHPGYIGWDRFLRNQERLDGNRTGRPDSQERPGVAREGAALLQGIVLCGRCGRRMQVRYLADEATPGYDCDVAHLHLGINCCQSVRGDGVDAAVATSFLEALRPAHLEVSLAALDQVEAHAQDVERQWQRQIERARYVSVDFHGGGRE